VTFNFWKEGFIPIFWFPLRISEQVIPSIQWMTVNIISTYRLLDLIGLDMIFDFPLDPLHLVYLGVVKRNLMTKWLYFAKVIGQIKVVIAWNLFKEEGLIGFYWN
jgi:hypothetical protein